MLKYVIPEKFIGREIKCHVLCTHISYYWTLGDKHFCNPLTQKDANSMGSVLGQEHLFSGDFLNIQPGHLPSTF
jgi:hypothetical protein